MTRECNSGAELLLGGEAMRSRIARLLAVSFFLVCAAARAQQPPPAKPPAANLPVVRLIATGGTIALKSDPAKKAPVPAISAEAPIATAPEIEKAARIAVQTLLNGPPAASDPAPRIQRQ